MASKFQTLNWKNIDLANIQYYFQLYQAMNERVYYKNYWENDILGNSFKSYKLLLNLCTHFEKVIEYGFILDDSSYYTEENEKPEEYWTSQNLYSHLKVWTAKLIIKKTGVNWRNITYGDASSYGNCLLGIKLGLQLLTKRPINDYCVYLTTEWGARGESTQGFDNSSDSVELMQNLIEESYEREGISTKYQNFLEAQPTTIGAFHPTINFGSFLTNIAIIQNYQKNILSKVVNYSNGDVRYYQRTAEIYGGGFKIKNISGKHLKLKFIYIRRKDSDSVKGNVKYGFDDLKFGISFIDEDFIFNEENTEYEKHFVPTTTIPQPIYTNPISEYDGTSYIEKEYKTYSLYYNAYIIPYVDLAVDNGFNYY